MDYNIQYQTKDITIVRNDAIDLTWDVTMNGAVYDLTGKQVDMTIKDASGTAVKTLSSANPFPAITFTSNRMRVQTTAITTAAKYKYDIQVTDAGKILTIRRGVIHVIEDIT